jgi:hypothetical protein
MQQCILFSFLQKHFNVLIREDIQILMKIIRFRSGTCAFCCAGKPNKRGGEILSKVTSKNQLHGKEIKRDYLDEAVHGYNLRTAMEEASRCVLSYDAPCSHGCPSNTRPGDFIRAIRFRNVKGAAAIIREANALGDVPQKHALMTRCARKHAAELELTDRSRSAGCRHLQWLWNGNTT